MWRNIFVGLLVSIMTDLSHQGEPCAIPPTGEAGECVFFIQCPVLLEQYKRDRTVLPVVCNKEERRICCPLDVVHSPQKANEVIESRFSGTPSNDKVHFISSEIVKKCNEYKNVLSQNRTMSPFVLGEPSSVTVTNICHQKLEDIGIAAELEFPHIAIIKLQRRQVNFQRLESKCIGSLISEFHVITSVHCVHSDLNHFVTVQLGSFKFDDESVSLEVEDIESKYGIAILKLKKKVEFSERVVPACLFPDREIKSSMLLTGWTGDWRDCDTKLKKWKIANNLCDQEDWQMKFNESAIMNYRQILLPGAPLQIYHPDNTCQYSLVGIFEQITQTQYVFNKLHKKLRWIENSIWPKKINQMSARTYRIIEKGIKLQ